MQTPDDGIKKVVIPYSSLPAISADGKTYIRYRIVYDDGSAYSSWSPKYRVGTKSVARAIDYKDISHTITSDGTSMSVVWTVPPGIDGKKFDVLVRWSYADNQEQYFRSWVYDSTTQDKIANLPIPTLTYPILTAVYNAITHTITYTTVAKHQYKVADKVTVTGLTNTQAVYNLVDAAITAVSDYTFTVSKTLTSPPTYSGSGISLSKAKYAQVYVKLESAKKTVVADNTLTIFQTNITTTKSVINGGTP